MNLSYTFAQNSDLFMYSYRCPKMCSSGRVLMKYTKVASLIAICIAQTTLANYYRKPFSFGTKDKQLNIYSSPAS